MPEEGYLERGRSALLAKSPVRAARHFEKYLKAHPTDSEGWFLLGAARHATGEFRAAKAALSKAIDLDKEHLQARFALASTFFSLAEHQAALLCCQEAVALAQDNSQAHTNLAIAYESLRRLPEALESYDRALKIDPSHIVALKNRGALLLYLGRNEDAIDNNRLFAKCHPKLFDAHFNLGDSSLTADRFPEAATAFKNALQVSPNNAKAMLHLGFALAMEENFDSAQHWLDCAAATDPTQVQQYRNVLFGINQDGLSCLDARTLFIMALYERHEKCEWNSHARLLHGFADILSGPHCPSDFPLGFRALATGMPPNLQMRLAQRIASRFVAPAIPKANHNNRKPDRPIRVAYLSQNFRNHATGLLACGLFAKHDRNNFTITAYAIGPHSDHLLRREIEAGVDEFTDLSSLDDTTAAERIAADQIDILIDLAGYTDYARPGISARRPVPIQVAWLAYPATTGAPWMDYIALDTGTAPPEMDQHCSEAIIRLPHTYFFCSYANESVSAVSRQQAGLSEAGRVLAAFHNGFKIDPTIFSIWMRLMQSHPDAVLWLLAGAPEMEKNLKNEATLRGVDPARLIFAPRIAHQQHLARFALADLLLDTPQCNGGTTICDALVAGVPVLTCTGAAISQRVATGLLQAGGFVKGITSSLEEYEARAHEWLNTPDLLTSLREELRQARSGAAFFQLDDWVSTFESALLTVWQRHKMGLPPQALDITRHNGLT